MSTASRSFRPRRIMPILIDQITRRKVEFIARLERNIVVGAVPPGHDTPCRIYNGTRYQGYAHITFHKATGEKWVVSAHRLFWVLANCREIPAGMEPDHTCRNRACVAHLKLVTAKENKQLVGTRGSKKQATAA